MEMSSSYTEELSVKMRKPYTITKLREKWTEEEHSRFLDALKLYGRAWQRIEEHIGTKTAIQIRSHAQKFFTKLEKEAVTTGTPLGQAHDIDIPPPRPKKRPSFPYPRKTGICPIPPSAEAAKTMDSGLGKNSTQELSDASNDQHSDGVQCSSAALNFFKDIPTPSTSSWDNNGLRKGFSFREFVPMAAQPKEPHSLKGSSLTAEVIMEPSSTKQEKKLSPDVEAQPASSHPMAPLSPPFHAGSSSVSHISHPCPSFPPFSQFIRNGKELYGSFLGISSAFSNLLASSLLQNPAVHAAACMATSVWPSDEMIPSNMAAVASATVAATSAWWATNGLVPFFLHAQHGFEFAAPPTPAVPSEQMCQTEAHLNLPSKLAFSPSSDEEQMEAGASILMAGTSGKQQERSSCGSNTTSGSETETDAAPRRNAEANDGDEFKPVQNLQPPGEACNTRRPRNCFCFNENWKEVSQEGRLAFQALFARDVLPQTFAAQHSKLEEMGQAKEEDNWVGRVRRTGFKPYKRDFAGSAIDQTCSISSSNKRAKLQPDNKYMPPQPSCSSR